MYITAVMSSSSWTENIGNIMDMNNGTNRKSICVIAIGIVLSVLLKSYIPLGLAIIVLFGILAMERNADVKELFSTIGSMPENKPVEVTSASEAIQKSMEGVPAMYVAQGSGNDATVIDEVNGQTKPMEQFLSTNYEIGTRKNPFGNVLLTDIMDKPERESATPAFNLDVQKQITTNVKRLVQRLNPTVQSTNKLLYGDLYQQFLLDKSNRAFYSTPNTRVANDQGAFAQYLYGYMPSSKGDSPDDNMQRIADNMRYNLY